MMRALSKLAFKSTLVAMLLVLILGSSWAKEEPFGLALTVKGEVLLTRGIIEFETKIEENLFYGDGIETGEDGQIVISFGSSFMSVGPNTSFTIIKQKTQKGKELIVIELDEGRFRSKILNLASNEVFKVATETGEVTVYGTDLVTGYQPDDEKPDLSVSVLKGKVGVRGKDDDGNVIRRGKPVLIQRNERSSMYSGGKSSGISELTQKQVTTIKRVLPIPGDTAEDAMYFAKKKSNQTDKTTTAGDSVAKGGGSGTQNSTDSANEEDSVGGSVVTTDTETDSGDDADGVLGGSSNSGFGASGVDNQGIGEEVVAGGVFTTITADDPLAADELASEASVLFGGGSDSTIDQNNSFVDGLAGISFPDEALNGDLGNALANVGGGSAEDAIFSDSDSDLGSLLVIDEPENPFVEESADFNEVLAQNISTDDAIEQEFISAAEAAGTDVDTLASNGGEDLIGSNGVTEELNATSVGELNIKFSIESGR